MGSDWLRLGARRKGNRSWSTSTFPCHWLSVVSRTSAKSGTPSEVGLSSLWCNAASTTWFRTSAKSGTLERSPFDARVFGLRYSTNTWFRTSAFSCLFRVSRTSAKFGTPSEVGLSSLWCNAASATWFRTSAKSGTPKCDVLVFTTTASTAWLNAQRWGCSRTCTAPRFFTCLSALWGFSTRGYNLICSGEFRGAPFTIFTF